jgi:ribosome recycling factor
MDNEIREWRIRQNLRSKIRKGRPAAMILEMVKMISEDEIERLSRKVDGITEELNYIKKLTPLVLSKEEEEPPYTLPGPD